MKKEGIGKRFKKLRRSKYRLRILLTFFLVAMISMAVIDVSVFRGLAGDIREDSDRETREMLQNLTESFENQADQYQEQAQLLYRNMDVKSFLVSGGREDSHLDSIYESMRAMAGNMTGISSVILFHGGEILASYDTGAMMMETKEEIVQKALGTTSDKEVYFVWADERHYRRQMVVLSSDRDYLYGPSSYGVAFAVSVNELQEKVLPENSDSKNPVYIFHKDGEMVAAQKDEYKEEISAIAGKLSQWEYTEGSWYEDLEGQKVISFVYPEESRFFSVRVQEVSESQEQIDRALRTILLSTILGMLAVLIVVWFLAGWVYRPLGEIFRNILRLAQAEEDGQEKDELILAADALEDVNENMNFLKHQIRGNAVLRFLRQGKGEDGMDAGMFEFGACHPTAFRIMVLRYYMEDWNKNEALTASISQIYEKTARSEKEGMHCYRAAQGEVILLFFREGQGRLDGEEEAAAILEVLKKLYSIRGCVGIAGCGTVDELPATYRRAELLTEYYILSRETQVVDEQILKEKKKGEVQEPEREHILRWVKEDTEKGPEEYLKKLLENLSAYRIQEAQKYLKELIADVIRLSENIGGEYEQYEKYLEDFLKNPVFVGQANLEEWLCQLFYQVKDQLKDGRQTTSARVMGEVVAYIEENYDSCGLSVESVAEKYGFSVSYFSKLFNSYTGKTFPDYMNQLRLAKARAMLLECPELTIQEIAGKVGFNSSSYFSAAFRKYYGVTPSQLRKLKGH